MGHADDFNKLVIELKNTHTLTLSLSLSLSLSLTHTHTHTNSHTHTHTLSLSLSLSLSQTRTFTLTGICMKMLEYVRVKIFRAICKGRGGGQELSAEVIKAPV